MKVLYLSPLYDPGAFSGVALKNKITTEWLCAHHSVDIVFFTRPFQDSSRFTSNLHPVDDLHVWRKTKYLLLEIISSWITGIPFSVARFSSRKMQQAVTELVNEKNYDLIHVDHLWMFQYIPENWRKPILYEEHNIDSIYFERYSRVAVDPVLKLILAHEAHNLHGYEIQVIPKFKSILSISATDREYLLKLSADKQKVHVYPPVVTVSSSRFKVSLPEGQPKVLFLGGLDWPPNRHGFWWFYNEVWPQLLNIFPRAQWVVVGESGALDRLKASNLNVHIYGFQEQLAPFFDWADVFISPIMFGSGIKMKLLSAFVQGVPVVGSSVSHEGIFLSQELLNVANTPEEFVSSIIKIILQPKKYKTIALRIKKLILRYYNIQKSHQVLKQVYDSIT